MEQGQLSKTDMCRVAAALSLKQTIVTGSLSELWLKQGCVYWAGRDGARADLSYEETREERSPLSFMRRTDGLRRDCLVNQSEQLCLPVELSLGGSG